MKDDRPIKQRYQQRNPALQKVIHEKVDELLAAGRIEPSNSAYSAPVVLTKKKDGRWRMCIDYRQLNARSVTDAYPLPKIQHNLGRLHNAKVISSLDLKDGYWQIPMHPESRQYTAFTAPGKGLYQWKVMPFGLHSAPATFQRALDSVIGPDLEPHAFAYLDDIIVTSGTVEEHKTVLAEVFARLRRAKLRLNIDKCAFFQTRIKYLGHIVTRHGIHTDPDKIAAVKALEPPRNQKELRRYLGIASWYRRFVPDFAGLAARLTGLLRKGVPFEWGERQQDAFDRLKHLLMTAPVLACPDFTKVFRVETDASDVGLGAVLTQNQDDRDVAIAYASRQLQGPEKAYSATEKECLAIVWGIRKMREYVEGYPFIVITDHLALKWLNSIENPSGRIARWALELQQYDFEVQYRRGKLNVMADALSRSEPGKTRRTLTPKSWVVTKSAEVAQDPAKYPEYKIAGGQLYRNIPGRNQEDKPNQWKLCIPEDEIPRVLSEIHDQTTAGHQGIRKTLHRAMQRYYWPQMTKAVRKYVLACQSCQQYKVSQQAAAGKLLSHIPKEPWATVCIDFVGPLPRSSHGNSYLLVIQDKFSKWVELVPLRTATTETTIRGLRTHLISRFGAPKRLVSDNGRQFISRKFKAQLETWGIEHRLTAPYTPRENAVERANRTIKTMISQFADGAQRKWDEYIPELTLAMNTGEHESTGYTPAFLVQGRELRAPGALFDKATTGTGEDPEDISTKAKKLQETFDITHANLHMTTERRNNNANLRLRDWCPAVGAQVLVKEHPLSKAAEGFAAKLSTKFKGPFRVSGHKSKVIVTIQDPATGSEKDVHVRDLKIYYTS